VFSINLTDQAVITPSGEIVHFDIDPGRKEKLLKGLDAIGETLQHGADISAFEARRHRRQPWNEPGQAA
jgi:3-isopropylmalate dehydratase small subunit